ncbi:MAG: TetR/AcrR family transcriptional regulator [Polyangiaceae bacterium]|nr:TetR/AcrR family transcriptional regulator [Polyangiaceae bacterium]
MDVRSQILTEAIRLFAAQGFDGTSVQEIADSVGIRKPSLLYHFSSKEELRRSVLDEILSRWNDVLPHLLLTATHEQRFDKVMEALTQFFVEDPDRARLVLRELLDRPDDMRRRLETFVRPWIDVIAEQLEKARVKGQVQRDVDPHAYTINVVNMVVSGIAVVDTLATVFPAGSDHKQATERFVRELIRVAKQSLYTG